MADGKPTPPPLSPHEEGENPSTKPLYTTVLKSKLNSQNRSTEIPDLQIPSSVQSILVGSQKILLNQDSPKDETANRPSVIGLKLSQFAASSTTFPFNYQETPKVVFQKSDKAKLLAGMKHVLIIKFSHGRPSVLMMQNFLSNRKLIGTTHVSIFDAKHIFIEFEKFEDFVKFWIKQNGIINGFPVRFFKWDELFDPNKESSIVPIWIHLPQLPLYLFEEGALLLIACALGKPLHLDGNNLNRNKISYATICIEFDILRAPPREVWIQFGDGKDSGLNVGFSQKIVYGFMPLFCSSCCHIGHLSSVCKRFKTMVEVRDAMPVCTFVATEGLKNGDGKELQGVLSGFVECTSESEEVAKLEEGALVERLEHVAKRCYNKEVQGEQSTQTTTVSTRVLKRPAAENMGEGVSEHVAGGNQVDAFADGAGRAVVPVIVESAVITATEASAQSAAEPTAVAATGSVGGDAAAGECIEELSPTSRQYSAGTAGELAAVGHNAAADSWKSASWEPAAGAFGADLADVGAIAAGAAWYVGEPAAGPVGAVLAEGVAVSAGAAGSVGELVAGTVSDESSDVLGLCNGAKHVAMSAAEQLPTRNRFVVLNEVVHIVDLTLEEGEIADFGGAVSEGHAGAVGEYDTGQTPQQLEEAQGISVELSCISSVAENIASPSSTSTKFATRTEEHAFAKESSILCAAGAGTSVGPGNFENAVNTTTAESARDIGEASATPDIAPAASTIPQPAADAAAVSGSPQPSAAGSATDSVLEPAASLISCEDGGMQRKFGGCNGTAVNERQEQSDNDAILGAVAVKELQDPGPGSGTAQSVSNEEAVVDAKPVQEVLLDPTPNQTAGANVDKPEEETFMQQLKRVNRANKGKKATKSVLKLRQKQAGTAPRVLSPDAIAFSPGTLATNTNAEGHTWGLMVEKEDQETKDKREQQLVRDLSAIRPIRSYSVEEDLQFNMRNQKMAKEVIAFRDLYASQLKGQDKDGFKPKEIRDTAQTDTLAGERKSAGYNDSWAVMVEEEEQESEEFTADAITLLQERLHRLRGNNTARNPRILSDEMGDIPRPFKIKSAPNSPKGRNSSYDSSTYLLSRGLF